MSRLPPIAAPIARLPAIARVASVAQNAPTWESRIMLEPVLLDNAIIETAKHWRDEAIRRWHEPGEMITIGETTFISPVDQSERRVRLHVALWPSNSGKRPPKGFTLPPNSTHHLPKDGYYNVFLNRLFEPGNSRMLLATLLHELTHAVDPHFDADCIARKQAEPDSEYNLPSEQLAFTAMWIDELRERMKHWPAGRGSSFISGIVADCEEFKHFHRHAMTGLSEALKNQIDHHFNRMADHIRASQSQ
jgi:hypothetical protein